MTISAETQLDADRSRTHDIMIVDDNQAVTRALAALLVQEGYQPVVFHEAKGAVEHAGQYPPAAAVVDIHLPDLSGLILTQRLRETLGDSVPIIILSGDASMANLNSASHVGATYFFSKPVNVKLLKERLRELIV